MPIQYLKMTALCNGVCSIDEAESLKNWIGERRHVLVDLSAATHVHTAVVQVILASPAVSVSALPQNSPLLTALLAPLRKTEAPASWPMREAA